jgi:SET domain-containing protein
MIFKTPGKAKLCVASSPVHGKGLFAKDPIKEGDLLGVIKGFRSSHDGSYVLWVTEDHGVRMLCKFKYINHSDEPNVVLYDTLEVCALRDIARGEEIFHDYECADWVETAG